MVVTPGLEKFNDKFYPYLAHLCGFTMIDIKILYHPLETVYFLIINKTTVYIQYYTILYNIGSL